MKIAVTYDNGQIFQHFGHTEEFKVYEIENEQIVSSKILGSNGSGHGALATLLESEAIDVLICGGIGGGAIAVLNECGIQLFGGVSGDADKAVAAYLRGELSFNPNVRCSHYDAEHGSAGHTCGDHGCGNH